MIIADNMYNFKLTLDILDILFKTKFNFCIDYF